MYTTRPQDNGYDIIETPDGVKRQYYNGRLHCEYQPALEDLYHKAWYIHGELHR